MDEIVGSFIWHVYPEFQQAPVQNAFPMARCTQYVNSVTQLTIPAMWHQTIHKYILGKLFIYNYLLHSVLPLLLKPEWKIIWKT